MSTRPPVGRRTAPTFSRSSTSGAKRPRTDSWRPNESVGRDHSIDPEHRLAGVARTIHQPGIERHLLGAVERAGVEESPPHGIVWFGARDSGAQRVIA